MPTVSNVSKPAYVYDAGTDSWIPVGVGVHTHDTSSLVSVNNHFAAGKNKIINGDFGIWQRGTSFTATGAVYNADRFMTDTGSVSGFSASRSSFTAGTAPVAGYEGQYFLDVAGTLSNASTGYLLIQQRIEDVRALSNQTITLSFWAKGSASGTIGTVFIQAFGSGGSADVASTVATHSITTSWQRFTQTVTLGSMSGKTIGTGSYLGLNFVKNIGSSYPTYGTANYTGTLSIWGVQVEAGSVATPFITATGTLQGELAACQRYYVRFDSTSNSAYFAQGSASSTTATFMLFNLPVTMRTTPTSLDFNNIRVTDLVNLYSHTGTTIETNASGRDKVLVGQTGMTGLTQFRTYYLQQATSTSGYIGFSAEL